MSAREEIAAILWLAVPSADNAEAKAKAEQMIDRLVVEARTEKSSERRQPPLKGLVRQIRAAANEELALPTTYGKRAVQDFARDLETWIPENYENEAGDES